MSFSHENANNFIKGFGKYVNTFKFETYCSTGIFGTIYEST